jgi:O-antigen/teichoic acid export membrane protein
VIAALLAGATEAGFAALAVGVALAVTAAVRQAFLVQLPSLAERWSRQAVGADAAARRLAWQALVVVAPLSLAGALTADRAVRLLWGEAFDGSERAFASALALIPLAPLGALATQLAALRLRAGIRLVASGAGALVFIVTALIAVPAWEAAGASAALLAGVVANVIVSALTLRTALTLRLVAASLGAAALVLAAGVVA